MNLLRHCTHSLIIRLLPLLLFTIASSGPAGAQTSYRLIDLGVAPGGYGLIAFNNRGDILVQEHGSVGNQVLAKFKSESLGPKYVARDINDNGQVVGSFCTDFPTCNPYHTHAFIYDPSNGSFSDLGVPPQLQPVNVMGSFINNLGQVVGEVNGDHFARSFILSDGEWTLLPYVTGSYYNSPVGIEDNGRVLVNVVSPPPSPDAYTVVRAFSYENGVLSDLNLVLPGFAQCAATRTNSQGDITGSCVRTYFSDPPAEEPFLFHNGSLVDLGLFPGTPRCIPSGINENGTIVGSCDVWPQAPIPVIYEAGGWRNINTLLPPNSGWVLSGYPLINDLGVIVGQGKLNGISHFFMLDPNPDTTAPQLTVAGTLSVAAESASGALVGFNAFGVDEYSTPAGVLCDHPSGSLFPIGTTLVTCQAIDAAGNTSSAQSFVVQVIDTPPNLSLPGDVVTNATSSSDALVTYFASADDAVSGQLTAQCSPASGSTFLIGVTAVNCSATDGAGNTANGSFNVYVLTADQTYTPSDYYVTIQPSAGPTITFPFYVDAPGVTTVTPIDAASIGTTPAGFALSNGIAYQISTTVTLYDYVQLDFAVAGPVSESDFNNLSILHNNNGALEDVTGGRSYDSQTHSGTITAYTYSFSPFYLAKRVSNRIAPLFDQTRAFKAGSTIPAKLQVLNESDVNISAPTVALKARNLVRLGANTSAVVMDSGNANPDLNFRYDSGLRGYIFNLKTTGLQPGSYALSFYVGSERSFFYTVKFEVK